MLKADYRNRNFAWCKTDSRNTDKCKHEKKFMFHSIKHLHFIKINLKQFCQKNIGEHHFHDNSPVFLNRSKNTWITAPVFWRYWLIVISLGNTKHFNLPVDGPYIFINEDVVECSTINTNSLIGSCKITDHKIPLSDITNHSFILSKNIRLR